MTNRSRLHSVLWAGALGVSGAICFALMLQVTGVKSDIADTERSITAVQEQIATLETEFQTRARQQQLARWNEVDFGYSAPEASQFVANGAQLAALGKPLDIAPSHDQVLLADVGDTVGAPMSDVRVASADAPQMMRQLVARADARDDAHKDRATSAAPEPLAGQEEPVRVAALDEKPSLTAGERADIARRLAPEPAPASASQFAESFDFQSVIAGAQRN